MGRQTLIRAWLGCLVLVFLSVSVADAQVFYRRDPKERQLELSIDGRLYKPAGQAKLWEFRIHPFAAQWLTYNDNIFLEARRNDPDEDLISRTTLGFRIDLPVGSRRDHEGLLGYQVHVIEFAKRGNEDTLEHDAFLKAAVNFDQFYFDFTERIQRLSDPVDLVNASRVDRWKNTLKAKAGVFISRLMVELAYENRWFDFSTPLQSLDRVENYLTLTANLLVLDDAKILQQVFAFAEYEFGHFQFRSDFSNDSNISSLWIGAKGTLMESFPFLLKIGYAKQIANSQGTSTDKRDYEGFMWEARLTYRLDEQYAFRLASFRHIEVSGTGNYQVYDRGEIGFEMHFPPAMSENLFGGLHFFFDTADPSNAPVYSRVGAGLKLEYCLQDWLSMGLTYEFTYRYTNLTAGDYRNNQLSFHLTAHF